MPIETHEPVHEPGAEADLPGHEEKPQPKQLDVAHIMRVKEEYEEQLLKLPNVVGVGIGYRSAEGHQTGELALIVSVKKKVPLANLTPETTIPNELEGVPVYVQEVGDVSAY